MKINKSIKELRELFPYISTEELKFFRENNSYKTERGALNKLQNINKNYETRANMPDVYTVEIELSWSNKNSYGAWCPRAKMCWQDANGWHYEDNAAYASGCGYDKASSVIAECLDKICAGMLWRKRNARKYPYGVNIKTSYFPYFQGGVGVESYYNVAKFLGGKLEHVADSKTYDKYVFTFKHK